jgi:hypothetical protein
VPYAISTSNQPGTVSVAAGGVVVTGVGTNFSAGSVGFALVVGAQWGFVRTVASATSCTLDRPFATAVTGQAFAFATGVNQTGTDTAANPFAGLDNLAGVMRLSTGDGFLYWMPTLVLSVQGTITNLDPAKNTFICNRLSIQGTGNFTSGAFAADGVTPLRGGSHFEAVGGVLQAPNNAMGFGAFDVAAGGRYTFIGGTYTVGFGIYYQTGSFPAEHYVSVFSKREWGGGSARIRSWTTNLVKNDCVHYDIGLDLFLIPTVPPKVRGASGEYVYQYVGSRIPGGVDAKFVASALNNPNGGSDFHNWGAGWAELEDCSKGANLNVIITSTGTEAQHLTPLFRNVDFSVTDLNGVPLQGVRLRSRDELLSGTPTQTYTTAGGLKTWDLRGVQTYTEETPAGGKARLRLMLKCWHNNPIIHNLRFTRSTATVNLVGYSVRQQNVQVVLGPDAFYNDPLLGSEDKPISRSVAMVRANNLTLTEAQAAAIPGIAFAASGENSGTVTTTQPLTNSQMWHAWRAWKGLTANASSADSWEFDGTTLNMGAWNASNSTTITGSLVTTGTITLTGAGTIVGPYRDSNGLRIGVTGLDPEDFGITWNLRHRLQGTTTWTEVSGTGNNALILLNDGVYEMQVRAKGYEWESGLVLNTANSLSLNAGLRFHVSANNTPQYEMAFDEALADIFQYNAAAMAVSVSNETGDIISPGFSELYRATQRIQHIPELVWSWTAPVTANATSQKILIPAGNPIRMFLTETSNASVKITCPVIHADTGDSALNRVRGNTIGFSIVLGSPGTAEAAGLASQIISGLGGPNYESSEHGLSVIEELVQQVKVLSNAIKGRSDLIPNAPAAVGDAMTLTGDYDAAKTAATQESVDTLTNDVGLLTLATGAPLQADDYTAPDNAGIAAIKAKTDTLENADLSGVATSAEVQVLANSVGTPLQADAYVTPPTVEQTAEAVRTELATELGRLDVAVSTRSTLTAQDIPAGLSANDVWSHADRTLTVASGLTPGQQQALTDLQTEVGKLLKAADYTAPATAAAIAAQVELAILSDGDGRALLQAIADKIGNENLSAAAVAAAVWAATGRTLSAPSGLTDAQLQKLDGLIASVGNLHNADLSEVATRADAAGIASAVAALGAPLQAGEYEAPANADIASIKARLEATEPTDLSGVPGAVREELAVELGRIDVALSTLSTLKAEDIPKGLTAAEVWASAERTLTETAGLTAEQAQVLAGIAQGIEALGDPLQANDYTPPENEAILRVQTKIDAAFS